MCNCWNWQCRLLWIRFPPFMLFVETNTAPYFFNSTYLTPGTDQPFFHATGCKQFVVLLECFQNSLYLLIFLYWSRGVVQTLFKFSPKLQGEESCCVWNITAQSRLHGEQRDCLPVPALAHNEALQVKNEHSQWNQKLVLIAACEAMYQKFRLLGCLETFCCSCTDFHGQ